MAQKKKQLKSKDDPNGQHPASIADEASSPEAVQAWPDTSTPPSEEETQAWADQVSSEDYITKLDNSPKFDGDWTGQGKKEEPAPLPFEASSDGTFLTSDTSDQGWGTTPPDIATAVNQPEQWEQPTLEGFEEAQPVDDWNATNPKTFTLNIHQHSGRFDPAIAKILIYGETGTHKSRLASTFPNVIFADVDHGMSSVTEQVDVAYIEDNQNGFKQLEELYALLQNGDHGYETVVLDTLNEMQRVIMRFTVEEYTHIRRSYGNLPGQSDYGKMLYEFMELTRNFISLPMRVVLLAQVNSQEFDTDVLKPQLVGKNTARELLRKMDVVGYIYKTEAEEGTVPEITFDSPMYVTKDRSNLLPTALPKPSYNRIAAYWK